MRSGRSLHSARSGWVLVDVGSSSVARSEAAGTLPTGPPTGWTPQGWAAVGWTAVCWRAERCRGVLPVTAATEAAVRLSVPGKVILMGEHAAVYGRPAVVAAVDLRLTVEACVGSVAGDGRVHLDLPDIGVAEEHSWPEVEEFANRARRQWRAFRAGQEPFRASRDRSGLVRIAVGEAMASLAAASAPLRERSLELRLRSAIPVGGGLGSSAAAAVGVVAAVRAVAGVYLGATSAAGNADRKTRATEGASEDLSPVEVGGEELLAIEAAALEVERRQHGFPSGIDSGTVLRGGVLLVRREGEDQVFDDLPRREWLRSAIRIVDSGTPGQTTGAVVTTVRKRYEEDPDGVAEALDRIGAAAETFREALVTDREPQASAAVAAGHRGLVDLGVVPPAIARRIRRIEAADGAAKISGAGALEGDSAGALICMLGGRDSGTIEGLSDLAPVDAPIGADGLRFED